MGRCHGNGRSLGEEGLSQAGTRFYSTAIKEVAIVLHMTCERTQRGAGKQLYLWLGHSYLQHVPQSIHQHRTADNTK